MRTLLADIDALYACDENDRVLRRAWIVIEGSRIAALGEGPAPEGEFDARHDLAGAVATPGLVNAHHHFFQTLTRALPRAQRGHLLDWLSILYPVWGAMTPEDLAAAAAATSAELLLTGATASVDHFYLVPSADPAYIDAEIAAVRDLGLRLHLVRGSMTAIEGDLAERLTPMLGPRAGGIIDAPGPVLAHMRGIARCWHDSGQNSFLTVALGPTTPTYDDPEFMRAVARVADEFSIGVHMHVHPQAAERELCRQRFAATPLAFLDSCGLLGPRTWLAHATRMDEDDIRLLAERGVGVAHCPRMILRLGARVPAVHQMRAAGMRVAVGVDGAASNDGGSMLAEMRLALLLHRLHQGGGEVAPETWMSPYDVLLASTRVAASLIGRADLGRIAPGGCADVAAFDVRGVDYAGAWADPLSALLMAGDDSRAALTMVAGRTLVRNGRLLRQDEYALRDAVDRAAQRVVTRAAALTGVDYLADSLASRA